MDLTATASRAYGLQPGEDAGEGLRRIALGRIDHALDQLRLAAEKDFATGVHEARKSLKKLRALVRLLREQLGQESYRSLNRRYRDAGRALSGARDAEVKLATLQGLEERFPATLPVSVIAPFRAALESERPEAAGAADLRALAGARAAIAEGRAEVEAWALTGTERELLAGGLGRSYGLGRRELKRTRKDPTAHNAHEWRKRVKDLWYGLRLIEATGPEDVAARASLAHTVSEITGDHHDLSVLAEDAEERALWKAKGKATLLECISARQEELLIAALNSGGELYAEKPKRFLRRISLLD